MTTALNSETVPQLKALLHNLQRDDKNRRVVGAAEHKYQLLPPLDEAELQHFERVHGTVLPPDYRAFLRDIGNGGAGPCSGVLPLEYAVDDAVELREPFPWTDKVDTAQRQQDTPSGLLRICKLGCAKYQYLVVNGPAYGMVWSGSLGQFSPSGQTFGEWYAQWVNGLEEKVLPLLEREKVVDSIQVGMTKAEITEICGGHWSESEFGQWWGENSTMLSFDHLVTQFLIDDRGVLKRIVSHCIPV